MDPSTLLHDSSIGLRFKVALLNLLRGRPLVEKPAHAFRADAHSDAPILPVVLWFNAHQPLTLGIIHCELFIVNRLSFINPQQDPWKRFQI